MVRIASVQGPLYYVEEVIARFEVPIHKIWVHPDEEMLQRL
jgi:hypothetical protein